jgi:hypothetical protein
MTEIFILVERLSICQDGGKLYPHDVGCRLTRLVTSAGRLRTGPFEPGGTTTAACVPIRLAYRNTLPQDLQGLRTLSAIARHEIEHLDPVLLLR